LWEDEEEGEFAAPVRITVPVRMSELVTTSAIALAEDSTPEASPLSSLPSRLEQTLRKTFLQERVTPTETGHNQQRQSRQSGVEETTDFPERRWSGTVLQLLLSWREQKVLTPRLAFCALPSLEAWYRNLRTIRSHSISETTPVQPAAIHQVLHD